MSPISDEREPLLRVEDLRCHIATARGVVRAVDGVSFILGQGRTLGLVGESGSGKSLLVRTLMGLAPSAAQVSGHAYFRGADMVAMPEEERRAVWGRRIAMVFQDPTTALNPVVPVGRHLTETIRRHLKLPKAQAYARALELFEQVSIPEPEKRFRQYPHQFSGGMRQRATIAIALACDPDLLIADEATTALDVTVQRQILDLLQRLQRERNMSMILVSHDLGVVAGRADDIAVMYGGRVAEYGPTVSLFQGHRHRYTQALLGAIPRLDRPRHTVLAAIKGTPPDPAALPGGCAFAPRCTEATDHCVHHRPELMPAGPPGHLHACFVPVERPASGRQPGKKEM